MVSILTIAIYVPEPMLKTFNVIFVRNFLRGKIRAVFAAKSIELHSNQWNIMLSS